MVRVSDLKTQAIRRTLVFHVPSELLISRPGLRHRCGPTPP